MMTERFIRAMMVLSLIFAVGYVLGRASTAVASEWTITPVVDLLSHTSDIRRGAPFNDLDEPTEDGLFAGVIIVTPARKLHIEVLHGWKCLNCNPQEGKPETGTRLNIRLLPLGEHRWRIGKR